MTTSESERQHRRYAWLGTADVAERCGGVSNDQVLAWVAAGELRAWDASGPEAKRRELRFKPEWVDTFVRRRTINAAAA